MTNKNEKSNTVMNCISLSMPDAMINSFNELISEFEEIREIWILGSRANSCAHEDSDWDILVFANSRVLTQLQQKEEFKQSSKDLNIDLLILYDKDHFEAPWTSWDCGRTKQRIKKGTLSEWNFKPDRSNPNIGHYKGTHIPTSSSRICKMYRIWAVEQGWIVYRDEEL